MDRSLPRQAVPKLDAATLRRLAVRASCDPKTIAKAAQGIPVRGLAGQRARVALEEAGLWPPAVALRPVPDGKGGGP
jgi:hypothetical protein